MDLFFSKDMLSRFAQEGHGAIYKYDNAFGCSSNCEGTCDGTVYGEDMCIYSDSAINYPI